MNDLISRAVAIREYQEVCKGMKCGECPLLIKVNTEKGSHLITDCKLEAFLHDLPSAQPEQLTDKEQRIFLAAMGREEKVCKQVDEECCREPYEDSLVRVCHEIIRKVKATLWET